MRDFIRLVAYLQEEVIPEEENIQEELTKLAKNSAYLPPENQNWMQLSWVLCHHLGEVDTDWKQRVSDIVLDKEKIPEDWKPKCL